MSTDTQSPLTPAQLNDLTDALDIVKDVTARADAMGVTLCAYPTDHIKRLTEVAEMVEYARLSDVRDIIDAWDATFAAPRAGWARNALALALLISPPMAMHPGLIAIAAERRRQIEVEGWTPDQDDTAMPGGLPAAAACYAIVASLPDAVRATYPVGQPPQHWPWVDEWWKPSDRRRELVKAGALIAAEIDRIDRAASPSPQAERAIADA